jgi:hypothetical protein
MDWKVYEAIGRSNSTSMWLNNDFNGSKIRENKMSSIIGEQKK